MALPLLSTLPFRWFVPAIIGHPEQGMKPAANYVVKFYAAGTDIPRTIYDGDGNPYPSPSSVAVLNAEGYATIRLGAGNYKMRVCLPESVPSPTGGTAVYTQDNIAGNGSFGTGFVDVVVDGDNDPPTDGLAQVDTNSNKWTFAGGYWAKGDGGHGMFWNETSNAAEDGGYVIASTFDPTKRWFRVPDESGDVRAASFGYVGNRNMDPVANGDNLKAAAGYANAHDKRLVIGPGNVAQIGPTITAFTIYAPYVHFEPGAVLTGVTGIGTLTIHGQITGPSEPIFANITTVHFADSQVFQNPQWFGASTDALPADNVTAFTKWFAAAQEQSVFVIPPGEWLVTDIATFPYPSISPVIFNGILTGAGTRPTGVYFPDNSIFRLYEILFKDGAILQSNSADTARLVGALFLTGALYAEDAVHVTLGLDAGGDIVSNTGRLIAAAGASVDQFKAGGRLFSHRADASTSGSGVTTLLSDVVKGGTLDANGNSLKFKAQGIRTTSSGENIVFNVYLGSALLFTFSLGGTTNTQWTIEIDIIKTGANTVAVYGNILLSGAASNTHATGGYTNNSLSIALTSDQNLYVSASDSAQTITQQVAICDFYP